MDACGNKSKGKQKGNVITGNEMPDINSCRVKRECQQKWSITEALVINMRRGWWEALVHRGGERWVEKLRCGCPGLSIGFYIIKGHPVQKVTTDR